MALSVDSAIALALQQPGVRPAALVTLHSSSGTVYRFSVDTITWSGLTYQARLRQPPRVSVSPAAPERGQVGATTLALDIVDADGAFGQFRPGYFEGASCSVAYVVTDVASIPIRTFAFTVTDVQKPDLVSFGLTAEDGLSVLRRAAFPDDRWLISNVGSLSSNLSGLAIMPSPQPHVEGPNRTFPMMLGQCVAPAIVQYTISLSDPASVPTAAEAGASTVYQPIFGGRNPTGFDLVQRWNDNYSQVASVGDDDDDVLGGVVRVTRVEVHNGTPLHEGFQIVPLYFGGIAQKLNGTGARHTVTPPEALRMMVDSSYDGGPFGLALPYDAGASSSLHAVYRGATAEAALGVFAGSAASYPFHGFHGYIAEQRPADQWIGSILHDGMLGAVWRDKLVPLGLCFSRTAVASFTTANIIEGSLSWRDLPPAQLETTRTISYRRQSRDVEPTTSFTWSAAAQGAATARVSDFVGHAVSAWRPAQFWARREAYGRRRYTWRTGLFAFAMEQHDLVRLHFPTIGASGQLCEVDAVELLPDWTVQVQARETDYSLFTFVDTPDFNWKPDLRFAQRVKFPQSSWALGTNGSSFRVDHNLIAYGAGDAAAAIYTSPLLDTSYPSSRVTANNSQADFWVANIANSGATVPQFEKILLAWDLVRRG